MMRQLISLIFLFIVSAASATPPNILLILARHPEAKPPQTNKPEVKPSR